METSEGIDFIISAANDTLARWSGMMTKRAKHKVCRLLIFTGAALVLSALPGGIKYDLSKHRELSRSEWFGPIAAGVAMVVGSGVIVIASFLFRISKVEKLSEDLAGGEVSASTECRFWTQSMRWTFRVSCLAVAMIAIGMTCFMNMHAMDSMIDPTILLPIALLPYVVLGFAIYRAGTGAALASSLVVSLITLWLGFWCYYDGLFVRFSTLNASLFIEVPILQLAPAIVGWFLARVLSPREGKG